MGQRYSCFEVAEEIMLNASSMVETLATVDLLVAGVFVFILTFYASLRNYNHTRATIFYSTRKPAKIQRGVDVIEANYF